MSNNEENNDWEIGSLCTPRACKAGEGYGWLVRAFKIFKYQPASWVAIVFFISLASVAGSIFFQAMEDNVVKIVGGMVVLTAFQIMSAGLFIASHRCEQDHHINFSWVFLGFSKFAPIFIFSAIYSIMILIMDHLCQFLLHTYGSGAVEKILVMVSVEDIQQALADPATRMELLVYTVVWMTLIFSLAMVVGFSPALIVFHNVSPLEAIKLSIVGFVRNINPFAVYGLLFIAISILFSVLISLLEVLLLTLLSKAGGVAAAGVLLIVALYCLLAIAWISMYTAYSDIFWLRQNEMSA